MILVTLSAFLAGVTIGWRHTRIGGLYLLIVLILVFAAVDYAVDHIVVWPYKYWLIVDLIVAQIGYLVGAALGFIASERKDRNHR
jgi:cytochrome c oxidase subunit IV